LGFKFNGFLWLACSSKLQGMHYKILLTFYCSPTHAWNDWIKSQMPVGISSFQIKLLTAQALLCAKQLHCSVSCK